MPAQALSNVGGNIHAPVGVPADWKVVLVGCLGFGHVEIVAHQKGIGFFRGNPRWKGLLDGTVIAKGMGGPVLGDLLDGHEAGGSFFQVHAGCHMVVL